MSQGLNPPVSRRQCHGVAATLPMSAGFVNGVQDVEDRGPREDLDRAEGGLIDPVHDLVQWRGCVRLG